MRKRYLLFAVVIAVLLFTASFGVSADTVDEGTCGENLTWSLDDQGTLTIEGTGAMTNFSSSFSVPWYKNHDAVKTVIIGDGVTSIEQYAFSGCGGLSSITIPESVTSIGREAFYYCVALTEITIPKNVMGISQKTFYGCRALADVTIGEGVTEIGEDAFYQCTGLNSITIPQR